MPGGWPSRAPSACALLALLLSACQSADCLISAAEQPADVDSERQHLLRSCLGTGYTGTEPLYFRDFLNGLPARLKLDSLHWSSKLNPVAANPSVAARKTASGSGALSSSVGGASRAAPRVEQLYPLTVITTLTVARRSALAAQCNSWGGPLTAAVYVPLHETGANGTALSQASQRTLQEARHAVADLFAWAEGAHSTCALRLLLLTERVAEPAALTLFPINTLRNLAITASSTPLVAMVDVDLLLASSLTRELQPAGLAGGDERMSPRALELVRACQAGQVFVMPAFEPCRFRHLRLPTPDGIRVAEHSVRGGKSGLLKLVRAQRMCYFQENDYPPGHNATRFPIWYQATWPYQVKYSALYEPWFIVDRRLNPWYDHRYRGYGWNKQQQVAAVAWGRNLTIMVHPTAYVVHRPHDKTSMSNMWCSAIGSRRNATTAARITQMQKEYSAPGASARTLSAQDWGLLVRAQGEDLFLQSVERMKAGGPYEFKVDPAVQACTRQLPWWAS